MEMEAFYVRKHKSSANIKPNAFQLNAVKKHSLLNTTFFNGIFIRENSSILLPSCSVIRRVVS